MTEDLWIGDMSLRQIRTEIAEYLGYFIVYSPVCLVDEMYSEEYMVVTLCMPDGTPAFNWMRVDGIKEDYDLENWLWKLFNAEYDLMPPDWTTDLAAALELCIMLVDRLNEYDPNKMWRLEFTDCCVSVVKLCYGGQIYASYGKNGRDALAMSQLALEILRDIT